MVHAQSIGLRRHLKCSGFPSSRPSLFILLLLHWVMQRKDTAVWNDGLKKRTGNIEMKCLAGHLDSMEEEAITETPATEPAALTASTSAGDVSVDLEVAEGMAENPRMSTRSSSIRNNTLGWDGSTWEGDERLTDACTRMQSFLSVQQSPIKKTKSVNYSAKDPLQVGLIDIKLTIKEEKSLTSMFVKRAQSASPLGRTRKGRSPSRESIIPAIPRRKKILQGVSGAVGPGITAILGPSGCGKTTPHRHPCRPKVYGFAFRQGRRIGKRANTV